MQPDDSMLKTIEERAAEMAHGAGAILAGHFGKPLQVEYKDEHQRDPVTNADKETQEFLKKAIADHFPDHGVLAEEDEEVESPAPDYVWVLDPLDGTKNFLAGLPVYASSIGVLYQGAPIAGAIFVPWPAPNGGVVLHAHKGGGAFADGQPISVSDLDEPKGNSLATLPGFFGAAYRFRRPMRGKVGELRVTGSIAYELAMTARGVLQYSLTTGPHMWDVAAGAALVTEAGGLVMSARRPTGLGAFLSPRARWEPLESFAPTWESGKTSMKQLRRWSAPMATGSPAVVRYVTSNVRSRLLLRRRLARAVRRLKARIT